MEDFRKYCRSLSISPLYRVIQDLYQKQDYERLKLAAGLYMEYFKAIPVNDDHRLNYVKFYRACSQFSKDPPQAISEFEELLRDPQLPNELRPPSEHNLRTLYRHINNGCNEKEKIPKILHLLYFGETNFEKYHYVCAKSMLKHLPDYQVFIYNGGKEPEDNPFWTEIKNHPRVTLKIIKVPTEFDGFELKHFQYKADVVRLEQLYEQGGVYLDLDLYLVRGLDSLLRDDYSLYLSFESRGKASYPIEGGLINCVILAKPKNEFLKIWLDSFKTGLRMENWAYHIRDSNRHLLNMNPHYLLKYKIKLLDSIHFCPFGWNTGYKFAQLPSGLEDDRIYGVHLFETITAPYLDQNPLFRDAKPDGCEEIRDAEPEVKSQQQEKWIVGLTLGSTPERQKELESELTRVGLLEKTHIMVNQIHPKPNLGCFHSHIGAIRWAKDQQLERVLVFEDDVIFKDHFDLEMILASPPEKSWDLLYLGGILTEYREQKDGWVRGTIWCNHAYLVHSRLYEQILEKADTLDLESETTPTDFNIDMFYTRFFHGKVNCWLKEDQPVVQRAGFSLIDNREKWGNNFNWDTWTMKTI